MDAVADSPPVLSLVSPPRHFNALGSVRVRDDAAKSGTSNEHRGHSCLRQAEVTNLARPERNQDSSSTRSLKNVRIICEALLLPTGLSDLNALAVPVDLRRVNPYHPFLMCQFAFTHRPMVYRQTDLSRCSALLPWTALRRGRRLHCRSAFLEHHVFKQSLSVRSSLPCPLPFASRFFRHRSSY